MKKVPGRREISPGKAGDSNVRRMGIRKKEKGRLKIDSSTIGMESARSYQASNTTVRRFMITDYQASLTQSGNTLNTAVRDNSQDTDETGAETSGQQKSVLDDWQNRFGIAAGRITISSQTADTSYQNIQTTTLRYIFDLLFASRRGRLTDWMKENGYTGTGTQGRQTFTLGGTQAFGSGQQNGLLSGVQSGQSALNGTAALFTSNLKVLNYSQETLHIETEDTSFSTVGTVRTADGREIAFNVEVGMSRAFQQYYREDLELASFQMCDPLVINLDTDVAQMSDQKFYFDIDADGEEDEISRLGSGSGYLALDKNGDGVINDGSELFGTSSGDGFADLAGYDEDGNGWIDENDAVWSKLKIWCKDENGNDVLYRLADRGVGAICLQKAATDFTLQGGAGQTQGAIRSTGVFLYENGTAGTVQHVDVAKYSKEA